MSPIPCIPTQAAAYHAEEVGGKGEAMNKIIVIGHLGRDPEMRYLPSGQGVSNFSVATSRKYTTS